MENNNGFFSLSPEERADAYERACKLYGVSNFFDLSPSIRSDVYEMYEDQREDR